ncbi:hypothetical protein E1B28_009625 [Marasmius oreades]|uniref:Uncharacterized protein n=1 Tax=Marasmius oreades TaxID=181124 RepID=A0A9P7UQA6_9AGAR|nr:uncharacterized protein E1B28_009625 [Marasmius oreades]KAG7090512.1 hypothetical protein E1B28_009625 [Marasmius oreades]
MTGIARAATLRATFGIGVDSDQTYVSRTYAIITGELTIQTRHINKWHSSVPAVTSLMKVLIGSDDQTALHSGQGFDSDRGTIRPSLVGQKVPRTVSLCWSLTHAHHFISLMYSKSWGNELDPKTHPVGLGKTISGLTTSLSNILIRTRPCSVL